MEFYTISLVELSWAWVQRWVWAFNSNELGLVVFKSSSKRAVGGPISRGQPNSTWLNSRQFTDVNSWVTQPRPFLFKGRHVARENVSNCAPVRLHVIIRPFQTRQNLHVAAYPTRFRLVSRQVSHTRCMQLYIILEWHVSQWENPGKRLGRNANCWRSYPMPLRCSLLCSSQIQAIQGRKRERKMDRITKFNFAKIQNQSIKS